MNINIEETTIKELTSNNKHLMQTLHEGYGFDFMDDYKIYRIDGKYTANSLKSYTTYTDTAVILMYGEYSWDNDNLYLVEYLNYLSTPSFNIDNVKKGYHYVYTSFYRKSDFEEIRKDPNTSAWLLVQGLHANKNPRVPKFTDCERFKFKLGEYGEKCYIPYGYNGLECTDTFSYRNGTLDKSGYPVDLYRDRLAKKVEELRAQKAKEEYLKTDNSDKVATLERLIGEYKAKLAEKLIAVETPADVWDVDRLLGWNGLHSIIEDFVEFKQNTEEKSFNSIKASDALYDRIAKNIYSFI